MEAELSSASKPSGTGQRSSFYENLRAMVLNVQRSRKGFKMIEMVNGEEVNMTPKALNIKYNHATLEALALLMPQLGKLQEVGSYRSIKSASSSVIRSKTNRGIAMRLSMDDVIAGVKFGY